MAISYVGAGAGTTDTHPSPAYPAGATTDLVLALWGGKQYNVGVSAPAGWSKYTTTPTSGSVANSTGSGSVAAHAWYDDTPTTGTGTVLLTSSPNANPGMGQCLRFASSGGAGWLTSSVGLSDTDETGTAVSAGGTASSGQFANGDWLVVHVVIKDDVPNHTTQALAVAGCTLGSITWLSKYTTTFGNDGATYVGYVQVTAGSSTGTVTYTATSSVSAASATAVNVIRLREAGGGTSYTGTPADSVGVTDSATDVVDVDRAPADTVGVTDSATSQLTTGYDRTPADSVGLTDSATRVADMAVTVADPVGVTDTAITPAPVQLWNAENGTQGAALTATSVPYSQTPTNGAGCSQTFDNAHVVDGSLAYKYHAESTLQATGRVALASTNLVYSIRVPFWATTAGQRQIFAVRSASANVLRLRYDGTNVAWANSANGSVVTATETLTAGSWYEVELRLTVDTATTGTYSIDLFNLNGSTPLNGTPYTSTTYNLGTAAISHLDFGVNDVAAFVMDLWLDQVRAQAGTMVGLGPASTATSYDKAPADPVGVTDTATPVAGSARAVSDPVGVTDTPTATVDTSRTPAEPVGVTDTTAGVAGLDRSTADPVGAADTVAVDHTRQTGDSVGLTDTATTTTNADRAVSDPAAITDTVAATRGVTSTDTVGVTDTATVTLTGEVTPADPVPVTDTATTNRGQGTADSAPVTDTVTTARDTARATSDPVGVSDTATHTLAATVAVGDPVTATDTTTTSAGVGRSVTDPVAGADEVTSTQAATRSVSDLAGVTDSATVTLQSASSHTTADPVGVTDTTTTTTNRNPGTNDPVSVTDTLLVELGRVVTVADLLDLIDRTTQARATTVADLVPVADGPTTTSETTLTDPVAVTDPVNVDRATTLADLATVTDLAQLGWSVTITDTLAVTDTVTRIGGLSRDIDVTATLGARRATANLQPGRATTLGSRLIGSTLGARDDIATLDGRRFDADVPA